MHRDRVIVGSIVGGLILIFLLGTVWPTEYRYDHIRIGEMDLPVRIERFTGRTECFAVHHEIELPAEIQAIVDRADSSLLGGKPKGETPKDSIYFAWSTRCIP